MQTPIDYWTAEQTSQWSTSLVTACTQNGCHFHGHQHSRTIDTAVEHATVVLLGRWCPDWTDATLHQQTQLHQSDAAVNRMFEKTTASEETLLVTSLNYKVYLALKLWSKFCPPSQKPSYEFTRYQQCKYCHCLHNCSSKQWAFTLETDVFKFKFLYLRNWGVYFAENWNLYSLH